MVQALFDERIGEQVLNQYLACYTDISDSPEPDPKTFAEQLIADKTRVILIVDNCPPGLHSRLTQTCTGSNSRVSLLTVEYDVRDDLPEETSVFKLEPASVEIIETLLRKRFSHIGQIDARTIADLSGGNARVAIALGCTVKEGESLSGFRNDELFQRLFKQRHDTNENLLISAEICSLVYSFEGDDTESENSELCFLASLTGKSCLELYRDVNALKKRDLIQSRNVWRAVLPHAIANWLAKRALESIPKNTLVQAFFYRGSDRLIKSFTRRLSYLHDCVIAIDIVNYLLAPDGWIGKENGHFNDLKMEILSNIAPVAPEKTLEAIEYVSTGEQGIWFISKENTHNHEIVKILRHLAYDPVLFDRSIKLMCSFALSEKSGENNNYACEIIKSLFYLHLSGTHASVVQRSNIVQKLLESEDQVRQELGILLLNAALESRYFSGTQEYGFGARQRDFGYRPSTHDEVKRWYEIFIDISTRIAVSNSPVSTSIRKTLASSLRGIWSNIHLYETIEKSAIQIHEHQPWYDGFVAISSIIQYDKINFEKEILDRLYCLKETLRPNTLLDRTRLFVLLNSNYAYDFEDVFDDDEDVSSRLRKSEETARNIGVQVAQDTETLNSLLPEIVSTAGSTNLFDFGKGLAEGCSNKQKLWDALYNQFERTPYEKRRIIIFKGILSSCVENDNEFYQSTLDDMVSDELFGEWFPMIQVSLTIDQRGIQRLHESLEGGKAQVNEYKYIAYGCSHESISDDDLANLLRKILTKEGGIDVAIEILKMRFFRPEKENTMYSTKLISVGRDVLMKFPFPDNQDASIDSDLSAIFKNCLNGEESIPAVTEFCNHLVELITDYKIYTIEYNLLFNTIACIQPLVFLEVFLGNDKIESFQQKRLFVNDFDYRENPLNKITDEIIISWCDCNPENRYPLIVLVIQSFFKSKEPDKLEWKPIVYSILEKAPDLSAVLNNITKAIIPTSCTGSLVDILQKCTVLFECLYKHDNELIQDLARTQYYKLQERIEIERAYDHRSGHDWYESFE